MKEISSSHNHNTTYLNTQLFITLTSQRQGGLTASGVGVEVLVVGAGGDAVLSVAAAEVGSADVVSLQFEVAVSTGTSGVWFEGLSVVEHMSQQGS